MKPYHDLVQKILDIGEEKSDRTGIGTLSIFGHQMRFNLEEGFPLLTTKKTHFKSVAIELLWFLKGHSNIKYLKDNGVSIWDEWADSIGELGPVYGVQWRSWRGANGQVFDQIKNVIEAIKTNPYSRRHIVSAWNVADIPEMKLPPCHAFFQFYVCSKNKLHCQLYQRSADVFLGVPFNIASYALLTHLVASVCKLGVGEFIHTLGDAHLYKNHLTQTKEMLSRDFLTLPKITFHERAKNKTIDEFEYEDIIINNYIFHPGIRADVAV